MRKLRLFALTVLIALVSSQLAAAADFAAVNDDGVKIYYNKLDETTCEVTASDDWGVKYSGTVRIPSKVSDGTSQYDVVSIGRGAFEYSTELTTVVIPEGVETIATDSFGGDSDCCNLAGQKVGVNYKGIVVKNGKKVMMK